MAPSPRLHCLFLILIAALAPVSGIAGSDLHTLLARMRVGNAGARTTVGFCPETRAFDARTFGFDGRVMCRDLFRLNADGKVVAWRIIDGRGMARYRVLFTFDRMGRNSGGAIFNKDGKLVRSIDLLR